ncbi:DUF2752 domain-containing protein [Runella sp. MFBS21]|uniref:DUF2752 domain-containing protein n=1 Tax=Runella sp. MFBS21 TaxID=3034018 RepID=UPI0023F83E5C|nr:DUF2752 domain-containing protein [Runella sp. MFBS21]MDF7819742.1 DUF2752 domain-containing protein [Runella sp. MFBS21]
MLKKITLTVTALSITVFYFYYNPAISHFGPPCLVHKTTGLYCWGCGGQRALHALLHGHLRQALHFNLLISLVIPILSIVFVSEIFDIPNLRRLLWHRYTVTFVGIVVSVFTIVRNLKGFEFLIPD